MKDMKNKLRIIMRDAGVDAILLTDPYSMRYYIGFGGEGVAVVTENTAAILTDSRYTEAAGKAGDFAVFEYNPKTSLKNLLSDILLRDQVKTVGFENKSISYADYCKFQTYFSEDAFRDAQLTPHPLDDVQLTPHPLDDAQLTPHPLDDVQLSLVPLEDAVLRPRRVKSPEEVSLLRKAESIGDRAFDDILKILKPGMTELEVAAELEYSMKRHGAEGLSFDTIAASGANSSMPHAVPTEKKLETGDFLTMDFGCLYHGYCSDMTRTVVIGKASAEQRKVYEIVRQAQQRVLDRVKAGLVCKEVDAIARDYIRDAGYGAYFGHGLGHSVGLYIHEEPAFNTRDDTVLEAGMVITDEPGIYLPGKFGVRIEDMILITADGCENLASSPKELIEL